MATPVIMPKQGNTVESVILSRWRKKPGDPVRVGEVLCEVETDKALLEVESAAEGILLATFFNEGDTVPVMTHIAVIGVPGEDTAPFRPGGAPAQPTTAPQPAPVTGAEPASRPASVAEPSAGVSPRARRLAHEKGVSLGDVRGTGPDGRIIERDVRAALSRTQPYTPLARALLAEQSLYAPSAGTGLGGRITAQDLRPVDATPETVAPVPHPAEPADGVTVVPLRGVRRITADRMRASLQNSAQLTLNTSADARALQAYRQRLKSSDEALGLRDITINDLVLYAVARTLPRHPELNATLDLAAGTIAQYAPVHLGMAVDTPRGLLVPVIRNAHALALKPLSDAAGALAQKAINGRLTPDEMQGGTFTVTNLGGFGIEDFTPVINLPQVAILGVGNINLKPVQHGDDVRFVPHIGLSLTIDHQVVDGAPGARFLRDLAVGLANIDLLLAQG